MRHPRFGTALVPLLTLAVTYPRFHPGGRVANARYHDCASAHDHDWASNDVATRDHRCARHHRSSHH